MTGPRMVWLGSGSFLAADRSSHSGSPRDSGPTSKGQRPGRPCLTIGAQLVNKPQSHGVPIEDVSAALDDTDDIARVTPGGNHACYGLSPCRDRIYYRKAQIAAQLMHALARDAKRTADLSSIKALLVKLNEFLAPFGTGRSVHAPAIAGNP